MELLLASAKEEFHHFTLFVGLSQKDSPRICSPFLVGMWVISKGGNAHSITGFPVFITARFLVFIWNSDALALDVFNTHFLVC